jgi:hypothetical protein
MPSAEYDLGYIRAALQELETYLLTKKLFWPINASSPPGEPVYPRLTLGGLLLAQARSKARWLSPSLNTELAELERHLDILQDRWRAAWGRKAAWEFRSRLEQWKNYLNELRADPEDFAATYGYEVRLRVMLDLLTPSMDDSDPAYLDLLTGLDALLKVLLIPGEFIWEEELERGFPEETYWYLWGEPER